MVVSVRIAALSDFHIGANSRGDEFGHDDDSFLAHLDRLEAEHDHIVLLGDIFQTEHGVLLGRRGAARQLARARNRVPRLSARFARYLYIHGNHDEVARDELGARESLRLESDGFAVFFIHGHQFDPLLGRLYPAARLATWFTGRLRRVGLGPLAESLVHQDITIKHARFGGPDGPYARAARDLLHMHDADAVIMGHTHVASCREISGERIIANTGSCSAGQLMHISIDTARRSVELIRDGRSRRRSGDREKQDAPVTG